MRAAQAHDERSRRVRQDETDVAEQCQVERLRCPRAIGVVGRGNLAQYERMTADRPLAENDQAPRQDVRALDGDRDRQLHVCGAEKVRRAHAHTLAAGDVHAVDDDLARALGQVVLGNGRQYRGLLAQIDRQRREHPRRVHRVQIAAHARQRFLDAFELAYWCLELVAHARVRAGGTHGELGHAGRR